MKTGRRPSKILAAILPVAAALAATAAGAQTAAPPSPDGPVVEIRQYKIVAGKRDEFIPFFEKTFVDSQEAVGITMVGQFRDEDDPNRFTWIRQFPTMAARGSALGAFYYGPVWQHNRAVANPMLDDNDDVLLLRPATPTSGFVIPTTARPSLRESAPPGLVVATIYYLWKDPTEGFSTFFDRQLAPVLRKAGLPVVGAFVPEKTPNDFPRLPVRQSEKVLVWLTRVGDFPAYEKSMAALDSDPLWTPQLKAALADFQERPPQILRLDPTPRSRLR